MNEDLDDLIICSHCHTLHKKIVLPHKKIAKCSACGHKLYSNVEDTFQKAVAFSITAFILFIVANLFPIIKVYITGTENDLTIPAMIITLFNEGFYVVGTIVLVVIVVAPLIVLSSYLMLGLLTYFKIFKGFSKYLISFLVVSKNWAMVDIFFVSILVALVKLFGYARITFGVSSIALLLFVIIDVAFLKSIKPIELWTYFNRVYDARKR